MTIPTEPLFMGEYPGRFKFWLMPRRLGEPRRIEGTATIVGDEWNIVQDAIMGEPGPPGEPAEIIRRDFSLENVGDLPSTGMLDESDWGRAWYINGDWHIFDHGQWYVRNGSLEGRPGITPEISITAEGIEAEDPVTYGPIEVTGSGPSTARNYHIKMPMIPGPEGPAAAITLASDYDDDDGAAEVGDFLVRKSGGKWGPGKPELAVPRKFTIPHNSFISHQGSEPRFLIAKKDLPAFDFDYYVDVVGHGQIRRANIFSSVSVEIEVRIGVTGVGTGEAAPLCGLGPYDPSWSLVDSATQVHILPHFSDTGNPDRSVAPDTPTGRCNAGDLMTVYVFIHRIGGSGSYNFVNEGAQLRINVEPAVVDL